MSLTETKGNFVKYFLFFITLLFISTSNFAQNKTDTLSLKSKNVFIVSVGYGYPSFASTFIYKSNSGYSNLNDKGAAFFRLEYFDIKDHISIAVNAFYSHVSYTYNDPQPLAGNFNPLPALTDKKNLGIGLRFNYYFIHKKNFHLYTGLGFGGEISMGTKTSPIFGEVVLGARFMFTKNIGIYIEAGAAKTIAQGGLSFKF